MTLTKENFRRYPLKILDSAYPALLQMREIAKNYPDIISEQESDHHLIRFIDNQKESDFVFSLESIKTFTLGKQIDTKFRINCNPHDEMIGGMGYFDFEIDESF
jgi:hypothetical protein